ncbi:hypothetical protein LCGC14_0709540 [marine sediment metagenome]|uniref:Uncharacterized protein n=1 Tax=marine sediment metagenome TaxID=412755 RepID=A0A0F9R100_9ZZZZ
MGAWVPRSGKYGSELYPVNEDPERCVVAVLHSARAPIPVQCSRKRGHGDGDRFCKQHVKLWAEAEARKRAWRDSTKEKSK